MIYSSTFHSGISAVVGIGFMCDILLLLTIFTMRLQLGVKIIVEEEEDASVKSSCHYKVEVCDLGHISGTCFFLHSGSHRERLDLIWTQVLSQV